MALIDYKIPGPHWKLLVTIMPLASMTENPLQLHKQPVRNLKLNGSLLVSRLLTLLATIAACLAFELMAPQLPFTRGPVRPNQHEHAEAVWEMLSSSVAGKLTWKSCYDGMHCARLMVPLDYADPRGPQAGIALVKVPATAPQNRGPVLINPGGPGESGVDFVLLAGAFMQTILGPEYDIVGFDPRGVKRTTPQVVVFPDRAEGAVWNVKTQAEPLANSTLDAISRIRARTLVYNSLAAVRTKHVSPYVGTAAVARDLLSITRAFGYEKLQYWGLSYGSVIGVTFSAMFPNNVGRIVIDGIVEANYYYSAQYANNLIDTDTVLHLFCEACVDAGPKKCALYEQTAEKVLGRINSLFANLKRHPIAVPTTGSSSDDGNDYGLVDYKLAHSVVFGFLYNPYGSSIGNTVSAAMLASALASAEKDDGLPLLRLWHEERFSCACTPGGPTPNLEDPVAVSLAIACGDGEAVETSEEGMQVLFEEMAKTSSFADMFRPIPMRCVGWTARSRERFTGPFIRNTSHPILLIGNTADPVTPLTHARAMSKGFTNAVVLTQNSAGHTSFAATSPCTLNAIRGYFREGTMPQNGTVCEVVDKMFDDADMQADEERLTLEERRMLYTWRELRRLFKPPRFM